jgi:hypothetical protein
MRLLPILLVACAVGEAPEAPPPDDTGSPVPEPFVGTLVLAAAVEEGHSGSAPSGACEGTFTVEGPEGGPWCGTGAVTCAGGIEDVLAPSSDVELCFVDVPDDDDMLDFSLVDVPGCAIHVVTDTDCIYRQEIRILPDELSASLWNTWFCELGRLSLEAHASR